MSQIPIQSKKMENSIYFELIQKVGSHGCYQIIISIVIIVQWFVIGAIELGPSLIFLSSPPDCTGLALNNMTCEQYICQLPSEQWNKYYPKKTDSLRYAFNDLFICNKQWIISLMQSMLFIGTFFSNVFYSYLPDNFGRKFAYTVAWGTTCIGLIILSISWHIVVAGIGLFLVGLGTSQTQSSTFMILYQQVKQTPRQYYGVLAQMAFSLGGVVISGVFYLVQGWRSLVIYTFTIPAILSFLTIYFLQENPKYILKTTNGPQKTLISLRRIAKMNGLDDSCITMQDIQNTRKKQKLIQRNFNRTITLKDAIKFKSLRIPTLFTAFTACCLTIMYYGQVLIIQRIGLDPLKNQAILTFSELITYPITFFLIPFVNRKSSGIIMFIFCGLIMGVLIFVKIPENCDNCQLKYLQLGLISISRILICIYYAIFTFYSIELIPTAARGVCAGVAGLIYRTANILTPFIVELFYDQNWNIMILFTMCSIIGIFMLLPLRQTLNSPSTDQIQQLNEQQIKQAKTLIKKQSTKQENFIELNEQKEIEAANTDYNR